MLANLVVLSALMTIASAQSLFSVQQGASVRCFAAALSWNSSVNYCEQTYGPSVGLSCRLAELFTPAQISGVNCGGSIWVGAVRDAAGSWMWYNSGAAINSPLVWGSGFPQASGSNFAYLTAATTTCPVLQNDQPTGTPLYQACTCALPPLNAVSAAQVYCFQQAFSWNNSVNYCENTLSNMLGKTCRLAEVFTAAQLSSVNCGGSIWIGAIRNSIGNWMWYSTGAAINTPIQWASGFPTAAGSNFAYLANAASANPVMQNDQPTGTTLYQACSCR